MVYYIRLAKIFVVALLCYIVVDTVWIWHVSHSSQSPELNAIMRQKGQFDLIHMLAGFKAWVFVVLGAVVFVLPQIRYATTAHTFCMGALYGLVISGVYQMTNYTILLNWPETLVVADMAWNMLTNGCLALLLRYLDRLF